MSTGVCAVHPCGSDGNIICSYMYSVRTCTVSHCSTWSGGKTINVIASGLRTARGCRSNTLSAQSCAPRIWPYLVVSHPFARPFTFLTASLCRQQCFDPPLFLPPGALRRLPSYPLVPAGLVNLSFSFSSSTPTGCEGRVPILPLRRALPTPAQPLTPAVPACKVPN